jgi:arylsulfatase A-like enzyme/Tfp pilus assembly protein PilF
LNALSASPKTEPRPRAWWQYLLAVALFGAAGYMIVARIVFSIWPELAFGEVPPIPITPPAGMAAADRVAVDPGALRGANVILVTLDTMRADRIGCYGNTKIKTPNLDELAGRGVMFTHALAPNPTTLPSHASILTGLYPFRHGARANGTFRLAGEHQTLAEILTGEGYATGAVISAVVLDSRHGLGQGFADYDDDLSEGRDRGWLGGLERPGDATTDRALRWMQEHAEQPFLLWVHLFDPHAPPEAPEPYASEYADIPYDGEIAFVDEQVGRLTFELEKLGKTDDTLVVVIGDHGEGLRQHKEVSHGFLLYDSTLRIPFMMACGSRVGGGVHIDQPVSAVDVTPTILSLLGIESPEGLDGCDLTQSAPPGRSFYLDNLEVFSEWGFSPLLGVYSPPHKYIWGPDPELYDLSSDPYERKNIIDSDRATAATMESNLKRFFGGDLRAAAFAAPTQYLSSAELEKLRALGYAGTGMGAEPPTTPLSDPKTMMDLVFQIQLALDLGAQDDADAAVRILTELSQEYPNEFAVRRYLAEVLRARGQYAEALVEYERCQQIRPDLALPHWLAGKMQSALQKAPQAIEAYRAALKLAPQHIAILSDLGLLQWRSGNHDEAAKAFRTVFDLTPSDDLAVEGMVAAYTALNRTDELAGLLEQRLAEQPRLLAVRNRLAQLVLMGGDAPRAAALLREGIELFPERVELVNNLAFILSTTADETVRSPSQAIIMLERAAQKTKYEHYSLLYTLSVAVAAMNRIDAAMTYAQRALKLAGEANDQRTAASIEHHIAALQQAKEKGLGPEYRPRPVGLPESLLQRLQIPDAENPTSQPAKSPD